MRKHIEQHISIPFRTLKDPAYLGLSAVSKSILEQMLVYYYPNNPNRHIGMSYREVRDLLGYSFELISKSFKELIEKKFITLQSKGGLNTASTYSINDKYFKLKDE
jgi:hypothetical protein